MGRPSGAVAYVPIARNPPDRVKMVPVTSYGNPCAVPLPGRGNGGRPAAGNCPCLKSNNDEPRGRGIMRPQRRDDPPDIHDGEDPSALVSHDGSARGGNSAREVAVAGRVADCIEELAD